MAGDLSCNSSLLVGRKETRRVFAIEVEVRTIPDPNLRESLLKYLVLAAHLTASPLKEKDGDAWLPEDLGLPPDLCPSLSDWNQEYRDLIMLGRAERATEREEIRFLDSRGLQLAKQVEQTLRDRSKVGYYSEGESRYLRMP